jgi:hypothetical protein
MPREATIYVTETVTLRNVLVSVALASVGILLLYAASDDSWWATHKSTQIVIRQVGSLLFVSVAINIIWSLVGKRAFLNEILEKAQIPRDIYSSGIIKVYSSFQRELNWSEHFEKAQNLDIFFAYANTWRNNNREHLTKVAANKRASIRVILPDPDNEQIVGELSRRFNKSPEYIKENIRDASAYFSGLVPRMGGAKVEVKVKPIAPQHTFYVFDDTGILALYNHARGREPVPTFVFRRGGTIYGFLRAEFDGMWESEGDKGEAAAHT